MGLECAVHWRSCRRASTGSATLVCPRPYPTTWMLRGLACFRPLGFCACAQVRFAVTHPADGLNTRALRVGPLAEAVRAVIRHFANKLPDMDGGEAALAEAKVSATRRATSQGKPSCLESAGACALASQNACPRCHASLRAITGVLL